MTWTSALHVFSWSGTPQHISGSWRLLSAYHVQDNETEGLIYIISFILKQLYEIGLSIMSTLQVIKVRFRAVKWIKRDPSLVNNGAKIQNQNSPCKFTFFFFLLWELLRFTPLATQMCTEILLTIVTMQYITCHDLLILFFLTSFTHIAHLPCPPSSIYYSVLFVYEFCLFVLLFRFHI